MHGLSVNEDFIPPAPPAPTTMPPPHFISGGIIDDDFEGNEGMMDDDDDEDEDVENVDIDECQIHLNDDMNVMDAELNNDPFISITTNHMNNNANNNNNNQIVNHYMNISSTINPSSAANATNDYYQNVMQLQNGESV
jgi:hypothetical protein